MNKDKSTETINDEFLSLMGASDEGDDNGGENKSTETLQEGNEELEDESASGEEAPEGEGEEGNTDTDGELSLTEYRDRLEQLQSFNEELSNKLDRVMALLDKKEEKPTEPVIPETVEFVTESEYEEALQSREALNKLLTKTAQFAYDKGAENILKSVPSMVDKQIEERLTIKDAVDTFWQKNTNLKPHREYVVSILSNLQSKHPDWKVSKLLEETSKESYKKLGVVKEIKKEEGQKKPAFSKTTGTRQKPEQLDNLNKEFREMMGKK